MVEGVVGTIGRQALWRWSLLVLCVATAFAVISDGASASPGDLDPAFGDDGFVSISPDSGAQPVLRDLVRLPNGSLLASGGSKPGQSGILARFDASGEPDTAFGTGGVARTPHSLWAKLVPADEEKVIAFGRSGQDAAIARFGSDGSLDESYGIDGVRVLDLRSLFPETEAILEARGAGVDSEGRAVAVVEVGSCSLSGEGDVERVVNNLDSAFCGDTALVRLTPDGDLDPSFGDGDGIRIIADPGGRSASVLTADDQILIASVAFNDSGDIDVPNQGWRIIQRLHPDGNPDDVFGEDGWAVFEDETDHPMAGLLQSDDNSGKITVSFNGRLMRLLPTGSPDPSFGVKGVARSGVSGLIRRTGLNLNLGDGAISADHIFLAGSATHSRRSGGRWSVVIRLNPDGTPDPTFSNDGLAARKVGPFIRFSLLERRLGMLSGRLLVDDSGRTIVGATGGTAEKLQFTLTRFKGGEGKRLSCDGQPATVQGTPGDDRLVAGKITVTGDGEDVITGGGELICTGSGDDRVKSWEARKVRLGPGNDSFAATSLGHAILGGAGNDRILGRNLLADGGRGDDLIDATRPSDGEWSLNEKQLVGGPGKDRLFSNWGKDRLYGGPGPDTLRSGLDEDKLFGGPGNDSLHGEEATDLLVGGPGKDDLNGGPAGPDYRRYWARNEKVRGLLEVLPNRIGRENLRFRVTCKTWRGPTETSWGYSSVVTENLKIRNGRFRGNYFSDPGWFGLATSERVSGRITPRWIMITIHDYEDSYDDTTCTARNLRFRLKRIRPLRQIVRQGG